MSLSQLVYYSRNTMYGDIHAVKEQVFDIVRVSQINNARNQVTGFLMADRSWFVQVLEGKRETITSTFERIMLDRRHTGVTLVEQLFVPARNFESWHMGGCWQTPEKFAIFRRHGVNLYFNPITRSGRSLVELALDLAVYERRLEQSRKVDLN